MAFKLVTPDRELNLGNPIALWTSWGELAEAMGSSDGEFPQLLYVPYTDEEPIPQDIWEKTQAQAILARDRYASGVSMHTRWVLDRIATGEEETT